MTAFAPAETADLSLAADAAHAVNPWVALAYLAAGVLFILALRGLSHPSTSRAGNRFGMIGMAIAVVTTLVTHEIASLIEILVAIAIGGISWATASAKNPVMKAASVLLSSRPSSSRPSTPRCPT